MVFHQKYRQFIGCIILILLIHAQSAAFISIENPDKPIDCSYVIITGFEPFASYDVNPSQLVVEALNGTKIQNATILSFVLPINFTTAVDFVTSAIDQFHPLLVINLGLAPSHRWINVETIAINLKKESEQPQDRLQRINPTGPFFQIATIPTQKISIALRQHHIPARQSVFAGTYLCNTVMYKTLEHIKENESSIPAGFIHLPMLSSQSDTGMELSIMLQAVTLSIETSLENHML